jgi:Tol biopolymer transport system component
MKDGPDELCAINVDGTDLSSLTKSRYIVDVKWSPDGGRLAFSDDSGWHVLELGSLTVLDITPKGFQDWNADWSPDSQQIVVARRGVVGEEFTPTNLCVVALNDLGVKWLTSFPDSELGADDPAWSPDGRWIAFSSPTGLYVVDVEEGSVRQVTHTESTWERYPLWAPR